MTTGAPRSLRGLDDGTLEAARLAARRSGLSISEWLDTAVARQAMVEGSPPRRTQRDDFSDDALAAAIERLTHRIRAMDEHSSFVLTDLHERLDGIARRARAVTGAKHCGADGSLTGVATIIENLSRDIDNADETARTTVEGMRANACEATQAGDVGGVAEAIRRLGGELPPDSEPTPSQRDSVTSAGLDSIRTRLEALLAASLQAPPDTGPDPTFDSPESRTEEAKNRPADGPTDKEISAAVAGTAARQQSIDGHIDLGALARGQRQIEESLDTLREGLAALSERLAALFDPLEAAPKNKLDVDRLGAIECEVAAIRRTLETAEIPRSAARLETRLGELGRGIETALTATNATRSVVVDALGRLESRLDSVLARVDTVLERSAPGDAIEEIKAEIGRIRQGITERDLPIVAQIESRLAGIARRLDAASESDQSRPALKELQEQVARVAAKLERGAPKTSRLKDIEARLLHLQDLLLANRREWAEAVSKAARDAAREIAESVHGTDPGRALGPGLENTRRASSAADSRLHLLKATGTDGAGAAVRQVEPGPTFSAGSLRTDVVRPNRSALRELAKSVGYDRHEDTTDRKADFIAAARRAAQATAERATRRIAEDAGDAKPGTFVRIGQAIRNRRRALLAATAALVLAVPAVHMFGWGGPAAMDRRSVSSNSITTSGGGDRDGSGAAEEVVSSSTAPEATEATPSATQPPHNDPSAFAFAPPGPPYARFRGTPLVSPAWAFVRPPDRRGLLPLADAIGSAELREAAAAGDPDAAVEVAARYAQGRLVPRDLLKAAQWYELAAEQGVAVAQYRLASLYERGRGVAKDSSVAADWYRRAAKRGNTGAMHNLAVMMSAGVDGAPNYTEAVEWFHAAADRGVEDSQYNLGVVYARGLGQDRNLVESYKWFALAAASGDREAGAHRDEIGSALSVDDLAKARAAADAWQPVPTRAQANIMAALPPAWSGPTDGITEADRRALVMEIQTALAEQGYDPGPADGFEGPRTRQAVRAFQRNIGLAETGTISSDLVAALADPSG